MRSNSDCWAGTPHPPPARSRAGLPPMYHSKTVHASSGCFVALAMTQPVAVTVGSTFLAPFQVGATSSLEFAAAVLSVEIWPLNQKPYCVIATEPLTKPGPDQPSGLGFSGPRSIFCCE